MRTVKRFAFIFGIANLVLGVMSFFSTFVKPMGRRSLFQRVMLPGRGKMLNRRSLINKRSGVLLGNVLGGLGAVNPRDAILSTTLGAAGIATRFSDRFSRIYMWIVGGLFAAMAAMGWVKVGMKPGVHNVMGFAVDRRDNIIKTLWGAAALLLAARPNLGRSLQREADRSMREFSAAD